MKNLRFHFGWLVVAALFSAGCASQNISANYTMPARKIADVGSVSLLEILTAAELSGNRVVDGDAERAAAMVRQNLSAQLYQERFYQTTDLIWGPSVKGASAILEHSKTTGSRHGYATFASIAPEATGRLEIQFKLSVDAARQRRTDTITLTSVPYVIKYSKDGIPSSSPNPDPKTHSTREVVVNYDVWTVAGDGTLNAKLFNVKTGELVYERTFQIAPPDNDTRSQPTLLRAVSAAVEPAIKEIVADISPHQERKLLPVNQDAHPRVVALLSARDYVDTVQEVERLEAERLSADPKNDDVYTPVIADFENKAIALEVLGDFSAAKMAWQQALALDPLYVPATEGVSRIEEVLAGKKTIRQSGAKETGGTGYKKDAINTQTF